VTLPRTPISVHVSGIPPGIPPAENDFATGTSIEFASGGFALSGNPFTLTEGIRMAVGVSDVTISAAVALDGSVAVDVADAGATLLISGDLSGDGHLTKNGDGALALDGAIAYTGGTTANAGSIRLPSVFTAALDAGITGGRGTGGRGTRTNYGRVGSA
jgi:autotransporter-associated beta strand protein